MRLRLGAMPARVYDSSSSMNECVLMIPEGLADRGVARSLGERGFHVVVTGSKKRAFELVEEGDVDVVLIGDGPEVSSPPDFCREIVLHRPDVRVIVVGRDASYPDVLAALRAGAFDYFASPVDELMLEASLHRALKHRGLREEVRRLRTALAEATTFEELVGASPPMLQLYELLEQAARSGASVLITGESGTGKELVARALHNRSTRRDGPFVAVNCSAIPDPLLESELFGHVRGAFTDARGARSGLFVKATGGTLFLDEIGEMPASLQPKLLRALQERVVRPVGGDSEIPVDVRLVTATNRNLEHRIAEGGFREDLFYRINVIHVLVPPLRERGSDILLLAQHYAEHFALLSDKAVTGLSPGANKKLLAYPWPGNVRELQNCMERAVALTTHHELQPTDLPERIRTHRAAHVLVVGDEPSELVPMVEVEKRYIGRVLQAVAGNKREAARILGFDRKTLYRKLERYGFRPASAGMSSVDKRER